MNAVGLRSVMMRKLGSSLIGGVLVSMLAGCGPERGAFDCGEVRLESQEQVAALAVAHCKKVGSLTILHGVESTGGLEDIERIDSLTVSSSTLSSLEGLSGLRSATEVVIGPVPRMKSLGGLDNLVAVDSFQISGSGLRSLRGLASLERARLSIFAASDLVSLEGLSEAFDDPGNSLSIVMTNLTDLEPLRMLRTIGDLKIAFSDLTSVDGLDNLQQVGGIIEISSNRRLGSLHGLESLRGAGEIIVTGNWELADISGIAGLTRVGALSIEGTRLKSLGALLDWPRGTVTERIAFHFNFALPDCEVARFFATQATGEVCNCSGNLQDGCTPPWARVDGGA